MSELFTMEPRADAQRKNLRLGLALGLAALLYIVAVTIFILVY